MQLLWPCSLASQEMGVELKLKIQAAIKQIIENEDKRRPLSDDLICRKLNEKGYDIRRRTVAKYRDRLGIPVARLRRSSQ